MMTEKPLTKQQLATLEGVYHKNDVHQQRTDVTPHGKPWFKYSRGNSVRRMVETLRDRGYLDGRKLTAKGYAELANSKAAMRFIDKVALAERMAERKQEEAAAAKAAEEERRQREERRRIAEETSRRERLAKLREAETTIMLAYDEDEGCRVDFTDDELLAFAARVHEIMEVY